MNDGMPEQRTCEVCGGPISSRNTRGICRRTDECNRVLSERNRRAKGMLPRGKARKGKCRVPSCPEPVYGQGWCSIHWNRIRKTGDPGPAERLRQYFTIKQGDVLG